MSSPFRGSSVASSTTLRGSSTAPPRGDSEEAAIHENDVEMTDCDVTASETGNKRRFVVAVDYGTTFSCVAYVSTVNDEIPDRDEIKIIAHWPSDPFAAHGNTVNAPGREVPSDIWYPDPEDDLYSVSSSSEDEVNSETCDRDDDDGYERVEDETQVPNEKFDDQCRKDEQSFVRSLPQHIRYGYEVQLKMKFLDCSDTARRGNEPISRLKLILHRGKETKAVRDNLRPILRDLRKQGIIDRDEDVIADYLTCLFAHTMNQLKRDPLFSKECPIEVVLCVPAVWTPKACRQMQVAMAIAMRRSGFGSMKGTSVDNLFLVNEPEAAAEYVLADSRDSHKIMRDEFFLLLDAGGGTVDAATYKVDSTTPLRLKQEAVPPTGKLCGSSYLNERMRNFVMERLKDEHYLDRPEEGEDRRTLVEEHVMIDFENRTKRRISLIDPKQAPEIFKMPGLQENDKKGFRAKKMKIGFQDFKDVFEPVLDGVTSLMEDQIESCFKRGKIVNKVVLIGGFSESPALVEAINRRLQDVSTKIGSRIHLIRPDLGQASSAVAIGAVMRALNKEGAPDRHIRSSYGVVAHMKYQPNTVEHSKAKRTYTPLDGLTWVKNTIDWFVQKDQGEPVPLDKQWEFESVHVFSPTEPMICAETIYVSDKNTVSNYQIHNWRNKGCERVGTTYADMTYLRTLPVGRLEPIVPKPGEKGMVRYEVKVDFLIKLDGRNLSYCVRYPSGAGGEIVPGSQRYLSVASAFAPGTF